MNWPGLRAAVEVRGGLELADCTGLRRGDLVRLPWAAVSEHAIIWKTGKSKGRTQVVIRLLPEAKVKQTWRYSSLAR